MNNNDIINQIKDSLDIADVIGERVKLRRTSRGFMGLCPFHHEDTPSFHVYTDTQSYYCFGCHEGGDIFTYLMKTEGLSFAEALRVLADRAGVKLSAHHREETDTYALLDLAAKFFAYTLAGNGGGAARAYLSRRDITSEDIARYSLGYGPNSWDALTRYLRSRGVSDKALIDSGLALANSHGLYDRFRGRIIFPIRDITGKVIAFGGRLIDGEGAKYLNSPEGRIYSKRRNLYLMDTARKSIRDKGRSILVEGYMDALRLNKSGFTETVASLGTSLTEEQAELLSRYADRCYICYDSDSAGQNAAVKGMYTLAEHGLNVYVVSLPEGKDPDDFLSSNPPAKFEELLRMAQPLILRHLDALKPALRDEKTRRSALNNLFEGLSRLNLDNVLQHMGSICDATMLPEEAVRNFLLKNATMPSEEAERSYPMGNAEQVPHVKGGYRRVKNTTNPTPALPLAREGANVPTKNPNDDLEDAICALLWRSPECRVSLTLDEAMRIMNTDSARETAAAILAENPEGLEELWLLSGETEKIGLIKHGEIVCSQFGDMTDAEKFIRFYSSLKLRSIERRIAEINSMPLEQRDMNELKTLFTQRTLFSR